MKPESLECLLFVDIPLPFLYNVRISLFYVRHYRSIDLNVNLTWVIFCNTFGSRGDMVFS
jgi:hypothetical protein